jgi:hypothetical protein
MVRPSAVVPRDGIFERRQLRTTDDSIVYAVELYGIEIAVAKFVNQPDNQRPTKIVIFPDCQAAIQGAENPKWSSDQHMLKSTYNRIGALRSRQ